MDIFRSNAANHNRGGLSGVDTIYSMDQEPLPTVRSLLHGVVGRRIEKEGQVKIKAVFCARPFWLFFSYSMEVVHCNTVGTSTYLLCYTTKYVQRENK